MTTYTYDYLERNGRLGNQLWQIAGTYSEAKLKGASASFNPSWTYRKYFQVPDHLFDAPEGGVVDMGTNYCQHNKYIDRVVDEARQWFAPSADASGWLRDYLAARVPLWWDHEERTAIHVRRGDYLKYPEIFPLPSVEYYLRNVARWPGAEVYVFSDDIAWCRDSFPQDWHFVDGTETPVEMVDRTNEPLDQYDLFAMAECDHHVMSNSTFSWWGAFLSGDETPVYPNPWFGLSVAKKGDNANCPTFPGWIEDKG